MEISAPQLADSTLPGRPVELFDEYTQGILIGDQKRIGHHLSVSPVGRPFNGGSKFRVQELLLWCIHDSDIGLVDTLAGELAAKPIACQPHQEAHHL